MPAKQKIFLALAVLLLASLACDYLPTPAPEEPGPPSDDIVATAVSATLTAAAGESPATDTPEPLPDAPPHLRIAFVKDGNVWFWEEGGAPMALTSLGDVLDVVLSDDGLVVAFVRQVDPTHEELHAVNTDGSGLRPLVISATFDTMISHPDALSAVPYRLDFVPGTHTLAFSTRLTFEGPGLVLPDELRLVDADSAALSILLAPGQAGDFYYSPDGSQIALVTADQVSVVNADGTNRRDLLSFPVVITYSEYNYYPPVLWSSGSDTLRAAIPPNDPMANPPELTTVWHLPADGSPPNILMNMATAPFFQDTATLSPDINKVAYLVQIISGSPSPVELHLSNVDGSGDVIYDTGELRFEAWSTDGEHFIYTQLGSNPKIGRVGHPSQPIGGVSLMRDVTWIDPTRYLYLNRAGSNWELWLGELGVPAILLGSSPGNLVGYDFTL